MARYLWRVSYTTDGIRGVAQEGGSARRMVADKLIQNLGGRMEAFYFALGEDDVCVIAEMPDNVSVAAASMAVGAAGGARIKTTVLMTPEEIDDASAKTVDYRPPGA